MFDFLLEADIYLTTFWYIAIPVSLIFLVQAVLTFIGAGDVDVHTDTDFGHIDSPMELFTLRNLINFLLGFSWGGICFYSTIHNKTFLVLASLAVGVIFVTLFFYIIQQIKKLEQNNTFDYQSIIGQDANVYLKIPESAKGKGKISVSYNGAVHELDAVSESVTIATGEKVLILDVLPDQVLLVKHLDQI
jgi:hypothetical protein